MHAGSFMAHPTAALLTAWVPGAWRGVLGRRSQGLGCGPRGVARWAAGDAAAQRGDRGRGARAGVVVALWRDPRITLRRLAVALLALAPVAGAYLLYNRALTGSPTLAPQERYMQLKEERGDCFRLGFGPGVGQCPITQNTHFGKAGFQPKDAKVNSWRRVQAFVGTSFGFAPLALLVPLGLFSGAWRAPRRRALLGGMILATVFRLRAVLLSRGRYGARFTTRAFRSPRCWWAASAATSRATGTRRGRARPSAGCGSRCSSRGW